MKDIKEVLETEKSHSLHEHKINLEFIKRIALLEQHDLIEAVIIEDDSAYEKDKTILNSVSFLEKSFYLYKHKSSFEKAFISKINYGENKGKLFLIKEAKMSDEEFKKVENLSNLNKKSGTFMSIIVLIIILFYGFSLFISLMMIFLG